LAFGPVRSDHLCADYAVVWGGAPGCFTTAVAASATPIAAATDRPWGGRSAFVADPEGNRWEITWGRRPSTSAAPAPSCPGS